MANWVRLAPFAYRMYQEISPRCVTVGTSLESDESQPRMIRGYIRNFRPRRGWSGYTQYGINSGNQAAYVDQYPGNGTTPATTGGGGAGHGFGTTAPGTSASVAGESNIWTTYFGDSGTFNADIGSFQNLYTFNFLANSDPGLGIGNFGRAQFYGGDFLTASTSRCRVLLYSGSIGLPRIGFNALRGGDSQHFVDNNTLSAGYNTLDINCGADTRDLVVQLNATNGLGPYGAGKNIYVPCVRWYDTAGTGLEMSFAAKGSSTLAQHLETTRVADAAIAAHVSCCEIDTVRICHGANGTINAQWKTDMLSEIDRWRTPIVAAGRKPRFLLVCQYQTGSVSAATVAEMWGYLSDIAFNYADVSAINTGGIDDGYALNNGLLSDTVHPTAAGADYFALIEHNAYLRALASDDA